MSRLALAAATLALVLTGCAGTGAPSATPPPQDATPSNLPSAMPSPAPTATTPPPTPTAVLPLALEVPVSVDLVPVQTLDWPGVSTLVPTKAGLWTVDQDFTRVVRRDPTTGRVTARIQPVGPVYANTIAFGALWTTDYDNDVVNRYDLQTGTHEQLAVGPGPDSIMATKDAIWIADHRGDSLERIDPATRRITAVQVRDAPGRGGPGAMTVAGGQIWVAVPIPGLIVAVDPETMTAVRSERVTMFPCGAVASGGVVWVDACGDAPSTIATLDAAGGAPEVTRLQDRAYVAGPIAGRDWLIVDGQLVAVERSPLRVTGARRLDVPILWTVVDGDDVWLVSEQRIDRVPVSAFSDEDHR